MSANNQTLIKEYKGKWYIFAGINAEAWDEKDKNILSIKYANGVYNSKDEAYQTALELDKKEGQWEEGTEYGVHFNKLYKDDTEIILTE